MENVLHYIFLSKILTLSSPHGFHDFYFHHEDDRGNYNSSKCGFRDEREIWREEHERKYYKRTSIDVREGRTDPRSVEHRPTAESSSSWETLGKGIGNVGNSNSD